MTNEIRLAFAHPDERAAAASEGQDRPLDRISLRDHVVEVEIGAFQAERGTTQRICFNIVVEVRPLSAPVDDDVDRILSYDRVTEAIAFELAEERLNLLETLAERIAARILLEPQAVRVFVRIEKLDRGPGALGVEIVRSRQGSERPSRLAPVTPGHDPAPHPHVIFLGNDAIADPGLSGWLDRQQSVGTPVVLCVGLPDLARPAASAALVQRRIDLLAMEQNAWVLAGRDPRCVVVETRTELDWGMRHGQVSVWAPSKIVLDSVAESAPPPPTSQPVNLAAWLAGMLAARQMTVVAGPRGGPDGETEFGVSVLDGIDATNG